MTTVTVNGNDYSDDGSASRDMTAGGHRTNLLPMVSDMMAEINAAKGQGATSPTTVSVTTGSVALVLHQASCGLALGRIVRIYSWASTGKAMVGEVTTAPGAGTSVVVNVRFAQGSGTASDWVIVPDLLQTTPRPVRQIASADTVAAGDSGKVIEILSSTFTLSLTNPASLGRGFNVGVRNHGSGVATLAPLGSTLIDGVSTVTLGQGQTVELYSDGSGFRSIAAGGTHYGMATFSASLSDTVAVTDTASGGGKANLHDMLSLMPRSAGYRSGSYLACPYSSARETGGAIASATVYIAPVFVPRTIVANRIGCYVTASAPATNLRLGIYGWDIDAGQPSDLKLDAGIVSTFADGAGAREITVSATVSAGWAALVVVGDAAGNLQLGGINRPLAASMLGYTSAFIDLDNQNFVMTAAASYGALASTFAVANIAYSSGNMPFLWLRRV